MTSEVMLVLETAAKLVKYMGHTVLQLKVDEYGNYVRAKTDAGREFFIVAHEDRNLTLGLTRLISIVDDDTSLAPKVVEGFKFAGETVLTNNCLHELQVNPFGDGFTLWAYHRLTILTDSCIKETLDKIFSGGFNIQ